MPIQLFDASLPIKALSLEYLNQMPRQVLFNILLLVMVLWLDPFREIPCPSSIAGPPFIDTLLFVKSLLLESAKLMPLPPFINRLLSVRALLLLELTKTMPVPSFELAVLFASVLLLDLSK